MKKKFVVLLAALLCWIGTAAAGNESGLYVKKIENLREDFILGMDVSSVLSLERSGVTYRDRTGSERDLFELLAENGINMIRVRVDRKSVV